MAQQNPPTQSFGARMPQTELLQFDMAWQKRGFKRRNDALKEAIKAFTAQEIAESEKLPEAA